MTLRTSGELAAVNTIAATHALVKRHVEIGLAKAAIEEMVVCGVAAIAVPAIEPGSGLTDELNAAGVEAVVALEAAHV